MFLCLLLLRIVTFFVFHLTVEVMGHGTHLTVEVCRKLLAMWIVFVAIVVVIAFTTFVAFVVMTGIISILRSCNF